MTVSVRLCDGHHSLCGSASSVLFVVLWHCFFITIWGCLSKFTILVCIYLITCLSLTLTRVLSSGLFMGNYHVGPSPSASVYPVPLASHSFPSLLY